MKRLLALALGTLLITGSAAHAQDYNRDRGHDQAADRGNDRGQDRRDDHHDWGDRDSFNHEWGGRGGDWDHAWRRGDHLPDGYWRDRRYIVDDYRSHRLPPPRHGYHWVRYGNGFCMVRDVDGLIYRVIRDLTR